MQSQAADFHLQRTKDQTLGRMRCIALRLMEFYSTINVLIVISCSLILFPFLVFHFFFTRQGVSQKRAEVVFEALHYLPLARYNCSAISTDMTVHTFKRVCRGIVSNSIARPILGGLSPNYMYHRLTNSTQPFLYDLRSMKIEEVCCKP